MYGSHLSIAGGLVNALNEAERLELDCVQVFTKNQRQWKVKPLSDEDRDAWLTKLKAMGWHKKTGPKRVVSHNSYLINMASPDSDVWKKSVALQREEIERCETLKIPLLVSHPGAHLGTARKPGQPHELGSEPTKDEVGGLTRIVKAIDRIHEDTAGYQTILCLETTVGSGSNLGYDFGHLAFIRDAVKAPERVGFCLDTCHVTAAGYDMTTEKSARAVIQQFDRICGLKHLHVFHFNDSVGEVGSRKDRHAHIGDGTCGEACFKTIVNRRSLARVPKILETPKEDDAHGRPMDLVNIAALKRLATPRATSR